MSKEEQISFLAELLKKISANDFAITTLIPKSVNAQTACSRLELHSKFLSDMSILAPE